MSEDSAADRFWLQLRLLYQAAGKPTLRRLVHLGLEQRPSILISDSTINGWLNGKAVPTGRKNERYLTVMIAFLEASVRSGATYERLPRGEWGRLLGAARVERAAGKRDGRPRRPGRSSGGPCARKRPERATLTGEQQWGGTAGPGTDSSAPMTPEFAVSSGALIGRDQELAMLADLVSALTSGRGGTVLIEGEPGIGKSALGHAAMADASCLGCQVFWGTGDELSQSLPLHPLLDALRVRQPSTSPRREFILRFMRGEVTLDRGSDGSAVLAEQLLALIADECARQPAVLVIDDLQWADQATVTLLGRVVRLTHQVPLLLVGMARPVPRRNDLLALRRAVSDASRHRLAPLDEAATAALVAALAGGTPDSELLRLADGAAGNPLYITELIGALTRNSGMTINSDRQASLKAGCVPQSLTAAIADRIDFVPGLAREVLRAAALLGVDFAVADLAIVLGCDVADLVAALEEASAAGILIASGNAFRFRHPLIHAALYEGMPMPLRSALHREAGRALAQARSPVDRVARQLLRATGESDDTPAPMDEWMVNWLAGAAESLVTQAPQVAAELLNRAVAGLPAGSARYGWLASRLADALYRIGDRSAAEQAANQALPHASDPDLLVDLHWTLAQCRMLAGRAAESLVTLDQALASPDLSSRQRARLLVLASRAQFSLGNIARSERVAADALTVAAEKDDAWAKGWALLVLANSAAVCGQLTEAVRLFDQALTVTEADSSLADLRLLLKINKAATLGNLDRHDETLVLLRQACQLADQLGAIFRASQAHCSITQMLFETGRWDDALAEMVIVPEVLKEPADACCEFGAAAVIYFHRGQVGTARRHLAAAELHAKHFGRFIPPLALAHSLDYELSGALPEAEAALTVWLNDSTEELGQAEELVADAVRLAMRTGHLATARSLAKHAAVLAAESSIPHRQANELYCGGLVDHDPARLLAAAECSAAASRPLPMAKALEAAGSEYARAGDREQALQAHARAVETYNRLGATVDAARVKARSEMT